MYSEPKDLLINGAFCMCVAVWFKNFALVIRFIHQETETSVKCVLRTLGRPNLRPKWCITKMRFRTLPKETFWQESRYKENSGTRMGSRSTFAIKNMKTKDDQAVVQLRGDFIYVLPCEYCVFLRGTRMFMSTATD